MPSTSHSRIHAVAIQSALVPDFSGENDQEEKKKKSCAFIKGLMAGFILRRHMFPDQPMVGA